MNHSQNRRNQFRRYADRRVAALLAIHEILFYESPGPERDGRLMTALNDDYQTDRVALVEAISSKPSAVTVLCTSQSWTSLPENRLLSGTGIERIIETHKQFEGALTLSRFRSSSAFEDSEWQSLWESDFGAPASALLSVPVFPASGASVYLWLIVDSGSREWSSHDRDLSEEEAVFFARVLDKGYLTPAGRG